jgi:hypothetical protein
MQALHHRRPAKMCALPTAGRERKKHKKHKNEKQKKEKQKKEKQKKEKHKVGPSLVVRVPTPSQLLGWGHTRPGTMSEHLTRRTPRPTPAEV